MLEVDESVGRAETASRQRLIQPGLAVRISDLADTLGGYASTVVEVDGHTIWVDIPLRRDGMLTLRTGQLVSVRFEVPDDATYLFDSVVADRHDDDAAPFGLAMPVTINRRPNRADTRLSMVLDAAFEHASGAHRAKVVDLSAGGLGLISDRELDVGDEVTVRCDLPGPRGPVEIRQTALVRTTSLYGRTPAGVNRFQYGLRFVDADETLREQILSSVIWNLTRNPTVT